MSADHREIINLNNPSSLITSKLCVTKGRVVDGQKFGRKSNTNVVRYKMCKACRIEFQLKMQEHNAYGHRFASLSGTSKGIYARVFVLC